MSHSRELRVVMVGPSGAGKTSLLASMYYHMKEEAAGLDGCFIASDAKAEAEMHERRLELGRIAEGRGASVDLDLGVKPSVERRAFEFQFKPKECAICVSITFIDLPGGWYTGLGDFETADRDLCDADVILVAVQAWPLLEEKHGKKGAYNADINMPDLICGTLERMSVKSTNGTKPTILFVLLKSESYLHNNRAEELLSAAMECYLPRLTALKSSGFPIAGCWIETVGGIELNHVKETNESTTKAKIIGNFKRIHRIGYSPKHCSVPLRLVLKVALEKLKNSVPTNPTNIFDAFTTDWLKIPTETANNRRVAHKLWETIKSIEQKLENEPIKWFK